MLRKLCPFGNAHITTQDNKTRGDMEHAHVELTPALPRQRNTELQYAVMERCRLVTDLTSGSAGLVASAIHRWCLADGYSHHSTTVYRLCIKLADEGMLATVPRTSEYVISTAGRRWLVAERP